MLDERLIADELMDDPRLDQATYDAVLRDLSKVNHATLAHPPTLRFLARAANKRESLKVLDVGYGSGDMLRAIANWGKSKGVETELVGIDLNPRSEATANALTDPAFHIDYRTGDYADLARWS